MCRAELLASLSLVIHQQDFTCGLPGSLESALYMRVISVISIIFSFLGKREIQEAAGLTDVRTTMRWACVLANPPNLCTKNLEGFRSTQYKLKINQIACPERVQRRYCIIVLVS